MKKKENGMAKVRDNEDERVDDAADDDEHDDRQDDDDDDDQDDEPNDDEQVDALSPDSSASVDFAPIDIELDVVETKKGIARVEMKVEGSAPFVDELDVHKSAARKRMLKCAAAYFDCNYGQIKHLEQDLVPKFAEACQQAASAAAEQEDPDPFAASRTILEETEDEIKSQAEAFLPSSNLIDELYADVVALGIVGERELVLATYLVGTSRVMEKPLGAIVQSASSSGKSFVTDKVIELMPPESVLRMTAISPQAWYYFPPGYLRHRFVVIGERAHDDPRGDADAANAGQTLRELLSRGEISKSVTMKSTEGRMETCEIHMQGPIALLQTTTQQDVFDEDSNRLISLSTDETPAQTRAILEQLKKDAAGDGADREAISAILEKHRTAQRMLEPVTVTIPYAPLLEVPHDRVTARRAMTFLLVCIKVVALLRQKQKKKDRKGRIKADIGDYRIARMIMEPVLRRAFAPVNEKALKMQELIEKNRDTMSHKFTVRDGMKWSGLSNSTVRTRLMELVSVGVLKRQVVGQGNTAEFEWVGAGRPGAGQSTILLHPNRLRKLWKKQCAQKKMIATNAVAETTTDHRPSRPRKKRAK